MSHSDQKGFTLVEILVVIAILGVLSAIAIPNLLSLSKSGTHEAAKTELGIVRSAFVAYMGTLGEGSAPETIDDLSMYLLTDLSGEYTITVGNPNHPRSQTYRLN